MIRTHVVRIQMEMPQIVYAVNVYLHRTMANPASPDEQCKTRLPAVVCLCGQLTFLFCWPDGTEEGWDHGLGGFMRLRGAFVERVPLERATVSGEAVVRLVDGTPVPIPYTLYERWGPESRGVELAFRRVPGEGGVDTECQVQPSGELPGDLAVGFVQALVELARIGDRVGFEAVAARAGMKDPQTAECYDGTRVRLTKTPGASV